MFCPNCGTQLPDDARFCGSCGTNLASMGAGAPSAAPAADPAPAATPDPAPAPEANNLNSFTDFVSNDASQASGQAAGGQAASNEEYFFVDREHPEPDGSYRAGGYRDGVFVDGYVTPGNDAPGGAAPGNAVPGGATPGNAVPNPGYTQGKSSSSFFGGALLDAKLAQAAREGLGMNWFKFIIYAQCFLGGLGGLIRGIMTMTGGQYEGYADMVYGFFPAMRFVDIVYGLASIAIGALLVYSWTELKAFKKQGVDHYLIVPIATAVASLIYVALACLILHASPSDIAETMGSTVSSFATNIALFFINKVYFDKRRHLFTEV